MSVDTSFIKKLELKPNCKYLLIFGEKSGLSAGDIANIPEMPELVNLSFRVEDPEAVTAVEVPQEGIK